jgi:hypothetical protein
MLPALICTAYVTFLAALVTPDLGKLGIGNFGVSSVERVGKWSGAMVYPLPGGRVRLLGLALGGVLTALSMLLLGVLGLPVPLGLLLLPPGYVAVVSRYLDGWSRVALAAMERELPSLTAFVLALAGMGEQPIPRALEIYADRFPGRPLPGLVRRAPPGEDPVAFVLARGIPSAAVSGVLAVLARVQDSPHRQEALTRLHAAQERRARLNLERAIEGRVARSPVAMVLLLFPALLATALVPVVVRLMDMLGAL